MAEIGLRMVSDVALYLNPITVVVTDLFAGSADRQQPAQLLYKESPY